LIVREASDADISAVCRNLRPTDRREQLATRFHDDVELLAVELIAAKRFAIKQYVLCTDDGAPAVFIAAYIKGPTTAAVQMCSTPRLPEIGRDGHRWGRRRFIPLVLVPNVRLAETRILAEHAEALRWVGACGFAEVGGPLPLGKNGETFVHVAWINQQKDGGDVLRGR
jgi:hypothetical protein